MAETTIQLRVTKEVLASQKAVFEKIWKSLPQIVFNPSWKNGTGYLDHAVDGTVSFVDGFVGGSYSFTDDYNRRGLLFIDDTRRVVIFERRSPDGYERSNVLVQNASDEFESFVKNELKEKTYPFSTSLIGYNDGDNQTRFERLMRFVLEDKYDAYC